MCIKLIYWEGIDHHYVDTLGAFRHSESASILQVQFATQSYTACSTFFNVKKQHHPNSVLPNVCT